MTELKLYKSSWKGLQIIGLSLPFIIFGISMICNEPKGTSNYNMGWFGTCFFGLAIPIGIFTLLDKRAQIIINQNGIFDRTLKQGIIKWEQIIEVYPIDINDQKFISIVVDDTFVFKKKQYKWAQKINKLIGAQKLNLNLTAIKVDAIKLSELINKIANSDEKERLNHIRKFSSNRKLKPSFEFQNLIIYFFILIIFGIITLSGTFGFMSIMILMGISALIVQWYKGTNNQSLLYKYAKIIVVLSLTNVAVVLLLIEIYKSTSNKVGIKLTNEIEYYKVNFGKYPNEIDGIREKLDLNFIQNYIANKIEYKKDGLEYELELESINQDQKVFDKALNEWN